MVMFQPPGVTNLNFILGIDVLVHFFIIMGALIFMLYNYKHFSGWSGITGAIITWLFSILLGFESFAEGYVDNPSNLPLTPYFQIFFMVVQTAIMIFKIIKER